MKEKLLELKKLREDYDLLVKERKSIEDEFKANNEKFYTLLADTEIRVGDAEAAIRTDALAEYEKTKEKKLFGGIQIKMFRQLEYKLEDALAWATEHKLALQLDKKKFEQIADESLKFVKISEIPRAQIPKDIKIENENI